MFIPNGLSGNLTVNGTTAQRIDISSADAKKGVIRFYSEVRAACIKFGNSSVNATAPDDTWLAQNAEDIFEIPSGVSHFSIITYGATGAVSYTIGEKS